MKATALSADLLRALKKLATIDKPSDGNPKVRLQFTKDRLVLIRADRDHVVEIRVRCQSDSDLTMSVEWRKFSTVMGLGVVEGAPISLNSESGTVLEISQGKGTKIKVPGVNGETLLTHNVSEQAIAIDTAKFFSTLKTVSVLCVDRIVGRGKFSGVMIHPDRMVAASHDGVVEVPSDCGIPTKFGVPYNVVWTLLNFSTEDPVQIRLPGESSSGSVRGVLLSGTLGEGFDWSIKFPFMAPAHSFSTFDLMKPVARPEEFGFEAAVVAGRLIVAMNTTGSIQNKSEVWVAISEMSMEGLVLESNDISKSSAAKYSCKLERFEGSFGKHPIQVKRTSFYEIVEKAPEDLEIDLGFDPQSSCLFLRADNLKAVLACSIKK